MQQLPYYHRIALQIKRIIHVTVKSAPQSIAHTTQIYFIETRDLHIKLFEDQCSEENLIPTVNA